MSASVDVAGGVYTVKDGHWSGPDARIVRCLETASAFERLSYAPDYDFALAVAVAPLVGGLVTTEPRKGNAPQPPPGVVL